MSLILYNNYNVIEQLNKFNFLVISSLSLGLSVAYNIYCNNQIIKYKILIDKQEQEKRQKDREQKQKELEQRRKDTEQELEEEDREQKLEEDDYLNILMTILSL